MFVCGVCVMIWGLLRGWVDWCRPCAHPSIHTQHVLHVQFIHPSPNPIPNPHPFQKPHQQQEAVDASLASRCLMLAQGLNARAQQTGGVEPPPCSPRLELALVYFFQAFRKMYSCELLGGVSPEPLLAFAASSFWTGLVCGGGGGGGGGVVVLLSLWTGLVCVCGGGVSPFCRRFVGLSCGVGGWG